jgi:hypothetical protein
MMGIGPAEVLLLLLLSPFGGLPVGAPPVSADAGIERIAAEHCFYWLSWSGAAQPDPNSENQAEQLLAEKEVQKFLQQITQQIDKQAAKRDADAPARVVLAREIPYLVKTCLSRPTAILLENVDLAGAAPVFTAGMVVNVGNEAESVQAALKRVVAVGETAADTSRLEEQTIAGVETWRLETAPDGPVWGFKNGYLLVGIGPASFETLVGRLVDNKRQAPAWLTALKKRLPTERVSSLAHIEVAPLLAVIAAKANEPQFAGFLQAFGLSQVASIESVSGFDREDILTRTIVDCGGEPIGLLNLIKNKPLEAADLRTIPANVVNAVALRLSPADYFHFMHDDVGQIDAKVREQLERDLARIEGELGVKLLDDVLRPFGDVITLFNTSEPANAGAGLTISVRDYDRLAKTHASLLALVKQQLEQQGGGPEQWRLKTTNHQKQEILSLENDQLAYAPSWTLTKTHLIIGLSVEGVQAALDQLAAPQNLTQVAAVTAALERKPQTEVLLYSDVATALENNFALLLLGATMANQGLGQSEVRFQIPKLPALTAIKPHLRPSVAKVARFKSGWLMERRQTLPVTSDMTSLSPVVTGLLLPAVQAARSAARRSSAMNNLKQIGLAMHNCHDAKKALPAAAIVDADGKPLLSWRVAILPYLQQDELYKQFHLDEPWDSEHNLKLLAKMPDVYERPGAETLAPGQTPYLAIVGEKAIFDAKQPRNFRTITDGLSKTIMVVEARADHAVAWTKPDDLTLDDNTSDALFGARENFFLACFGDGAVRVVADTIDAAMLQALLTRNGGEAVSLNDFP